VVGSNRLALNVRPLPTANQPDQFTGVIGEELDVNVALSQTEMHVGDPITLEITISGPPSVAHAEVPSLDTQQGMAQRFAFNPDQIETDVEDGRKTFRQTLRVQNQDVTELPKMSFAYFDSSSGNYETVATDSIAINVQPTDTESSTSAVSAAEEDPSLSVSSLRQFDEGIRFNYVGPALTENSYSGFSALAGSPLLIALLAASVGFFAFTLFYRTRYAPAAEGTAARVPEAVAAPSAESGPSEAATRLERELEAALYEQDAFEAVFRAWKAYLTSRLGLDTKTLTVREVDEALLSRRCSEQVRSAVRELFTREEAHVYGGKRGLPGDTDPEGEAARVREVSEQIETELAGS
jgi:hypothetical protein